MMQFRLCIIQVVRKYDSRVAWEVRSGTFWFVIVDACFFVRGLKYFSVSLDF